jgi:hypothetical protein
MNNIPQITIQTKLASLNTIFSPLKVYLCIWVMEHLMDRGFRINNLETKYKGSIFKITKVIK